jgi:Animal haem peroxidase
MHPGAITLHNFPRSLQRLTDLEGNINDLAAIDLMRIRERGVPRYNDFRELLHKPRLSRFEELSDNPEWVEELRRIYNNDIDSVDTMVGLYAEPLPPGFGFSDTAFRIFILMASRRLNSDRFFTADYNPRVYTQTGMNWINHNDFTSVLLRHAPGLAGALRGVGNPFGPWSKAGTS